MNTEITKDTNVHFDASRLSYPRWVTDACKRSERKACALLNGGASAEVYGRSDELTMPKDSILRVKSVPKEQRDVIGHDCAYEVISFGNFLIAAGIDDPEFLSVQRTKEEIQEYVNRVTGKDPFDELPEVTKRMILRSRQYITFSTLSPDDMGEGVIVTKSLASGRYIIELPVNEWSVQKRHETINGEVNWYTRYTRIATGETWVHVGSPRDCYVYKA